ncbi:hypothetical protein HYT55_01065 [Candidatus Woesearchaeota archaeon]|nr:hypothetical protein [Candidatus Woesearchaeota archaeon]
MYEPSQTEIQDIFIKAKDVISRYTGLELSLIEQVCLRTIAKNALVRLELTHSLNDLFPPVAETVGLFLQDYYGTEMFHTKDYVFLYDLRKRLIRERGYDALAKFYRRRQEEAHTPELKE